MKHQPITDDSFSEAEALRLMRGLGSARPGVTRGEDRSRRVTLTRTVEDEVIPRLLKARRPREFGCERPSRETAQISPENVSALVSLLMNGTQAHATEFVESLQHAGVPLDSLCLELLTPTARRLGVMWEEDECNFTDVTVGVLRLSNVMRLITGAFREDTARAGHTAPRPAAPSALLAQMPGEQHGLGLAMVVYFFRRAGWSVRHEAIISSADLVGLVRREFFGLVGLSVACGERLDALAANIRAIRENSCNRKVGIMVGGPAFIENPHLATMVGADATAADARVAAQEAQKLVTRLARAP